MTRSIKPGSAIVSMARLLLLSTLAATFVRAYEVKLDWTRSPDTNVIGYMLCFGGVSGNYTNAIDAGDSDQLVVAGLAASTTYYFAVAGYDASDSWSAFSNEVIYTTPPQLNLSLWPAAVLPALVSSNLSNWTATNFSIVLTNGGNNYFRFGSTAVVMTNRQPQ